MDNDSKQFHSEDVRYKARMATGAWLTGESLKEESKATMPLANSDHGDFETKSAIDKRNA